MPCFDHEFTCPHKFSQVGYGVPNSFLNLNLKILYFLKLGSFFVESAPWQFSKCTKISIKNIYFGNKM